MRTKRYSISKRLIWLGFLIVFSSIAVSPHKTPSRNESLAPDNTIDIYTTLVLITIEAKNESGAEVTDLKHEEIAIYENGKKQMLFYFARKEVPIKGVLHTQYLAGYSPINSLCKGGVRKVQVKNVSRRYLVFHIKPKTYTAKKDAVECN